MEIQEEEEEEKKNTGKKSRRRRRQSTWYANKKKTSIRATISKTVVSLSILLTLCAMLAQTLVYVEREEEAKRREEAKEDYQRAKEAMEKLFSSSSSLPCEDGGNELILPSIGTVESCRIIEEKSSTSITSSLLFNQSCLNVNAPEASGVIEELTLKGVFNSYDDKYSAVLLPHSGDIHTLSRRLGGEEKTDGASTLELQRRVLFCRDGVYNNRLWERRAKHKRAIGRANYDHTSSRRIVDYNSHHS